MNDEEIKRLDKRIDVLYGIILLLAEQAGLQEFADIMLANYMKDVDL